MSNLWKMIASTVKGKIIAIGIGVVVVIAVVGGVLALSSKEESYRTIAVDEVHGVTLISNEKESNIEAYEGRHLNSGDDVAVQKDSNLTLVLDTDKYLYAEAETHFQVECIDDKDSSRSVIHMMEGSVLNRLKSDLKEGESYEVETPNSTMAVRGTVFRVEVYRGTDGLEYTSLEVFEGKVQVDLQNAKGEYEGVSETFDAGEAAIMRGDMEFSEFVPSEDGSIKHEIEYKELPQDVAVVLTEYIDDGEALCIEKELLMDYTELAEHKMETVTGKEATCTESGYEEVWCVMCNEVTETVEIPALGHTLLDWETTKEATCEEDGSRQKVCSKCGSVVEEEQIVALGHILGETQRVEADCTHTGEQRTYCERCNKLLEQTEIAALGHRYGSWQLVKAATCIETGTNQRVCAACGSKESQTVAAAGHQMGTWESESIPTCEEEGLNQRSCSVCGYTETQTIVATGHTYDMGKHMEYVYSEEGVVKEVMCLRVCIADNCGYEDMQVATVRLDGNTYYCNICNGEILPD